MNEMDYLLVGLIISIFIISAIGLIFFDIKTSEKKRYGNSKSTFFDGFDCDFGGSDCDCGGGCDD